MKEPSTLKKKEKKECALDYELKEKQRQCQSEKDHVLIQQTHRACSSQAAEFVKKSSLALSAGMPA